MKPLNKHMRDQLDEYIAKIGNQFDGNADVMSMIGPLMPPIDAMVRNAIETTHGSKNDKLVIILQTYGGIVEVIERMVEMIRSFYGEVIVIVPDQAMSAGTVFALSADRIMMDYFSRLGPIDPQVTRAEKLVPALSYLKQYEKLNEKSKQGNLTGVEYIMLQQFDIGELYQFEQARELSVELLVKWLSQYKFKNWSTTETKGKKVTREMKQERAKKIADLLNDTERWHSHGRGISIGTLRNELELKIEDYSKNEKMFQSIRNYYSLLFGYFNIQGIMLSVHTTEYYEVL